MERSRPSRSRRLIGKERRVGRNGAVDLLDFGMRDLCGEVAQNSKRIAGNGFGTVAAVIGVILVLEGELTVGAYSLGKVWIAAATTRGRREHAARIDGPVR